MKDEGNNPLVSVIIPCYNVEKYLDRCMESVVNQTYKNLEIILVDDGSPDNSGVLCDEWAKKDNRIKVIHKENGGLGFARNSGMEIASGEYIAFVDSDDWIDIDMYETLISEAIEESADIVYCGHHWEKEANIWTDVLDFTERTIFVKSDMRALSLRYISGISPSKTLTMSVWHAVYRRNIISAEFYSEREVVSEDLHFQLSSILNSNRIVYLPKAYYYYALNNTSLSHTFKFEKFFLYQNLADKIRLLYNNDGDKVANTFYVHTSIWILRLIMSLQTLSHNEKKTYIDAIAKNRYWKNATQCCISHISYLRLFIWLMKYGYLNTRYYIAWLDYWGICKKFDFSK